MLDPGPVLWDFCSHNRVATSRATLHFTISPRHFVKKFTLLFVKKFPEIPSSSFLSFDPKYPNFSHSITLNDG